MMSTDSASAHQQSLDGGRSLAPNLGDCGTSQYNTGREPYSAWEAECVIPLDQKLGFQRDSVRNMVRFEYCVPRCRRLLFTAVAVRLYGAHRFGSTPHTMHRPYASRSAITRPQRH